VQRHGLVERPARHLALGDVLEQSREGLHALAVEGREHQLALRKVWPLVQQDQGVGAYDRLEHPRALTRVEHIRRGREDLLDLGRI
jgi:hypothetical protein